MIKILILFLCLLFATPSYAGMVVGSGSAGGYNCLSGTYILGWSGDWPSDTDKACIGSGDTTGLDGTWTGADTSITYSESGTSIGFRINGTNDYCTYTQTTRQYADDSGAQTVWMRIYVSANPAETTQLFHLTDDDNPTETAIFYINTTSKIIFNWRGDVAPTSVNGVSATTWTTVGFSWNNPGNTFSVKMGSDAWVQDTSGATFTVGIDRIRPGNYTGNNPSASYIYVDKWALVDGYQATCPW